MPQMCPACSHNNTDQAQTCVLCGFMLRGLLGENTVLSNRYEITSVLGCGAMGAVYLATDRRLKGRRCAIKENRLDASASPEVQAQSRDQFMAEASVLARLDHPNLPKVSDYFIENEREYLVMDYVEGEDLDSRLQRVGAPLTEDQVLNWAQQILDALIYLHTQEPMPIIHRDIKPANLRVDTRNRIKLVDFGLVKLLDPNNPNTKVELRGLGTPAYAPLEQFAGSDAHTDARSDIYSLAATLYHLLTNVAPSNVHERLLNPSVLRAPREYNPQLSANSERVIVKAMGVHPSERYPSAEEMSRALAEKALPEPVVPPVAPAPKPAKKQGISPVLFGALAAVLAIALLAVAGFILWSGDSSATSAQDPPAVSPPTTTPTDFVPQGFSDAPTGTPTETVQPTSAPAGEPAETSEPTETPMPQPTPSPTLEVTPTLTPTIVSLSGVPAPSLIGTIAYPVFNGSDYDLYFGQANGSGTKLFRESASQPAFSPNGERIAFRSWPGAGWGLFTSNLDGSGLWQLARFVEDQLPTWTQDGNEIIFLSRREGDRKSRLMKVGSSEVNSLGAVLGEGEYPAVGRDGRLAFEGWGATGRGLRTANTNLQDVIVVTTNDDDTAPALSPNGRQVAFMSRRDGNWEIYVINVDGTNLTRLTEEPAEDGLPAWSPDGRVIAFASRRGEEWAIWAVSSSGGKPVKLFDMEGSPDGYVGGNRDASRGWAEERISWTR